MRLRLVLGSFAMASLMALSLLPQGCSSDDSTSTPTADGGGSSGSSGSSSGSSGSSGGGDTDAGEDASKPPTSTDCKLTPVTGVADVTPTFLIYDPPTTVPPTQTGGTLSGTYKVDKATVYLPTAGKGGLIDLAKTTGKVNGWATFTGTRYILHLLGDFSVFALGSANAQKSDVTSQGGFTAAAEKLTLDYSCDTTKPADADYSFTDDGSGRATILVKTKTDFGDAYIHIEAGK